MKHCIISSNNCFFFRFENGGHSSIGKMIVSLRKLIKALNSKEMISFHHRRERNTGIHFALERLSFSREQRYIYRSIRTDRLSYSQQGHWNNFSRRRTLFIRRETSISDNYMRYQAVKVAKIFSNDLFSYTPTNCVASSA